MDRPFIANKRVLVTGGAGFIGGNICQSLLEGNNRVVCLDDLSTGYRENIEAFLGRADFRFIEGDIRDPATCREAVQEVDLVLHQAALGSVPRSIEDPLATHSVNSTGFLNMLDAARRAGVERFVYAVSSSAYGDSTELPKREEALGDPMSPYAVAKLTNELYARVFSDLYGIETIGLRYFNVFGPGQAPEGPYAAAIPRFIKAFLGKRSPVIYGDGEQSRDFTHIENVLRAVHLAGTTDSEKALNTVFNVAYGQRTTLNELAYLIRDVLTPWKPDVERIPIQYDEARKGDVRHSVASIEKARQGLGYEPIRDIRSGMERSIDWYVKHYEPA